MMQTHRSLAATCEDYNSDASETVPDTRKQANVAAKRTTPSPALDKGRRPHGPDGASDSGYSSHTAPTVGSAESAPSLKASHASSSLRVDIPTPAGAPQPSPTKRRPQLSDARRLKTDPSPNRASGHARTSSQSRKSRQMQSERYSGECSDPRCDCSRGRPGPPTPLDTPLNVNYMPFVTQPSPQFYNPPSPQHQRSQTIYAQAGPILEPARSTRRSTSTSRARPMSYHAGITPDAYWQPMPYGPTIDQRGPPPAPPLAPPSAYNTGPMPFPPLMTPPQSGPSYLPPPSHLPDASPPSPYRNPRPPMSHRSTETYSTRRPTSVYGPPVVSQDQSRYNTNAMVSARQPSARRPTNSSMPRYEPEPESDSYSSSDEEDGHDYDRTIMPPPRAPPVHTRRPSMRQPNPPNHYVSRSPQRYQSTSSRTGFDREPDERSSARYSSQISTSAASSRPSSSRRPSLATASGRSKTTSYPSGAKVTVVESSASSRRRMSYMGHERRAELEAQHRDVEAYQAEVAARARPTSQRREIEAARERENRRRSTIIEGQAYGDSTRSSLPLTEQTLRAAKRASRISAAASSEAGSGRSRASSSRDDGGSSRVSGSQRYNTEVRAPSGTNTSNGTATPAGAGKNGEGFKMRIDGINLEFVGDMAGRTIQLRQQEEGVGVPEVVIAGAQNRDGERLRRDTDSAYLRGDARSVNSRSRAASVRGSGRRRRSRAPSELRGSRGSRADD